MDACACSGQCLRFADRVAIVTGGCDGIGRGCVEEFGLNVDETKYVCHGMGWIRGDSALVCCSSVSSVASNGGKVAVFDIKDEIGATLKAGKVGEIFYIHCDMTEEDQIKSAITKTVERFGRLDCLVNNVGTLRAVDNLEMDSLTVENFKELYNINVVSAFTASKYSLPHLRKTKGSIINMSSIQATVTNKGFVPYVTTKGAIRSFTKALANDEGENGVRVNCIAPSFIATPLFMSVFDVEDRAHMANTSALNRVGTVEEVAKLCLFLATDATYMTGTEVMCTGGADMKVGVRVPGHQHI